LLERTILMAETAETPATPTGLREDGERPWTAVVDDYELGQHELDLLTQACHSLDSLAAINDHLVDNPLIPRC
jgi:hypothetical protein